MKLFIIVCLLACFSYGTAKTVRVRASVHCGYEKSKGVTVVSLMEKDFSGTFLIGLFDSDDNLDETQVEYGEHFTLDGSEFEIFSIEPYLRIHHRCFNVDREDVVDLSQFDVDPQGFTHLGHIVLTHSGYQIRPSTEP